MAKTKPIRPYKPLTKKVHVSGTTKMKHTKGEWKAGVTNELNPDRAIFRDSLIIARVEPLMNSEEAEANAQLISAALDMLEVGKLVVEFAKKVLQYPKGGKGYDPVDAMNLQRQIDKFQKAIAKAEGKH